MVTTIFNDEHSPNNKTSSTKRQQHTVKRKWK